MAGTDLHPLAAKYLDRLRREARCLPRDRRVELVSEIEAHLREATSIEMPVEEVQAALHRLGNPEQIVAADLPRAVVPIVPSAGSGAREVWTIILLLFGVVIFWFGWLVGVYLLWTSRVWTTVDKLIGTFILPGGVLGVLVVGLGVSSGGSSGAQSCPSVGSPKHCGPIGGGGGGGTSVWITILLVIVALAPLASAIYLALRAQSARRIYRVAVAGS